MAKKGYGVVCYESVSNPTAISEYGKLAATALEALGGRVILGGKPAKTHETGVDQSVAVVEFENLEKAIAAYDSDLLQASPQSARQRRLIPFCSGSHKSRRVTGEDEVAIFDSLVAREAILHRRLVRGFAILIK